MLSSHFTHIWCLDTESCETASEQLLWTLSPTEAATYAAFLIASDRREYLIGRALLRVSLSLYGDVDPDRWTLQPRTAGMVEAASDQLAFRLSHAGGLIACAISAGQKIGLGVERSFAAASESAGDQSPQVPFAALTGAFVDLIGSSPLGSAVSFDLEDETRIVFSPSPETGIARDAFEFGLFAPTPHHRIAVAIAGPVSGPVNVCAQDAIDGRPLAMVGATANVLSISESP